MASAISAHAAKDDWKQQFEKVSDEYFDQVYFHYAPTNGTLVGYHQYDAQLEDYSRKNIDAEIAALKVLEKTLRRFSPLLPLLICSAERPRDCACEHSLGVADAGNNSPVGEERGQLFEYLRECGVHADGAQVCLAGRAAALIGGARTADAGAAG